MGSRVRELFEDPQTAEEIRRKLPRLFRIAELEHIKGGKLGQEVGNIREQIVIALLMYKFGKENVEPLPSTQSEADVKLFGEPLSVKAGRKYSSFKLSWTVNGIKADEFLRTYVPRYDLIWVEVSWNKPGGVYYIPYEVQLEVFGLLGRENYIKLPKPGTNPRGIPIYRKALKLLMNHPQSLCIPIFWEIPTVEYDPYKKWVDLWKEE